MSRRPEAAVAVATGASTRPRTALAPRVVTPTGGVPGRPADRRSRPPVWRAGAGTTALVGGQLAAFTAFPDTASALLGVLAGGCVAAGSRLEARHHDTHGMDSGQSVVGVFAALMVASVTIIVLLGWSAMPWWAAVLVGMVTGPLLVTAAAGVRALVEQVLHRGVQEAELAATAGLLSGALCCALVATGSQGPVVGIIAAGIGTWVASSLAVGVLLPSPSPGRTAVSVSSCRGRPAGRKGDMAGPSVC